MPKAKKSESIVEKVEKTVKKVAKEIEEAAEKVEEKIEEAIEDLTTKTKEKKEDNKDKLAKLKAKAAKLAGEMKTQEGDLKEKIKSDHEEKKDALVPIEDYLKSSIHLGTRAITPDMKQYVYKRRADSLAVFNTTLLDEKIKEGAEYLAKYSPEEIVLVCKREAGAKAAELFSQTTGIRAFIKSYPAGILTNPNLDNFIETELVFICDPWIDKSALEDAKRIKVPVLAICDTNNYTKDVDKVIPGNNKSSKSLGMIFYLMTKLYVEKRKLKKEIPPIQEFIDGWDTLVPPK